MKLDPLLRKQLTRFRRNRRAAVSLALFAILGAVGLAADLLANDRPLLVRFQDRWLVPALRFYPEDTFTGSGRYTRPDYKELARSSLFAPGTGNRMWFAPVPFGPGEIIPEATVRPHARILATFTPVPQSASLDILPDLTVARLVAGAPFFLPAGTEIRGTALTNIWRWPAAVSQAVEDRFANRPAPALEVAVAEQADAQGPAVVLQLAAFEPRAAPPRTVRLAVRSADTLGGGSPAVILDSALRELRRPSPLLAAMDNAGRTAFGAAAAAARDGTTQAFPMAIQGREYTVSLRSDLARPYRPIPGHPLGLDSAGRDVLARLLHGLRTSLTFGLVLALAAMAIGTLAGALQGYFGGWVDITGQRLIEIWSAIPFLYVMILLGSVYGRSFVLLLVCYGLFNWIGISYYMRAEFLRLRRQPFVDAAVCLGVPVQRILRRHILPNALTPLITFFPFLLVGAIGSLTALDYLGFGLPPPTASWGELLQQAQQFRWAWWLILYPSLALFVVMLLGVFIGEGIRDAFDPRPRLSVRSMG